MLDRALALVGAAAIGIVSIGTLALLAAVVSVARNPLSKTPVPPADGHPSTRDRVLVNVETERFHRLDADLADADLVDESLGTALDCGFDPCRHCFDVVDVPEVDSRV